jgi:hypothetical protein
MIVLNILSPKSSYEKNGFRAKYKVEMCLLTIGSSSVRPPHAQQWTPLLAAHGQLQVTGEVCVVGVDIERGECRPQKDEGMGLPCGCAARGVQQRAGGFEIE